MKASSVEAYLPLTFISHINTDIIGTRLSMAFRKDPKKFTGRKVDVCISSSDSVYFFFSIRRTFCFTFQNAKRGAGGHENRSYVTYPRTQQVPLTRVTVVLYGAGVDGNEYRRSVTAA